MKQRLVDAAKLAKKEAMGDYSHLKNKKGEMVGKPLPQPTLPNLSVDDDDDRSSIRTRGPPPSTFTQDSNYYYQDKGGAYPPPMPAYNPYSTTQAPGSLTHINPSQPSLARDDYSPQSAYEEDDTTGLTHAAAPFAHQSQTHLDKHLTYGSAYSPSGPAPGYDAHDVYQGRAADDGLSYYTQQPDAPYQQDYTNSQPQHYDGAYQQDYATYQPQHETQYSEGTYHSGYATTQPQRQQYSEDAYRGYTSRG